MWPGGISALNLVDADAGHPAVSSAADRLDLSALAQIGGRLPLGQQALDALARYEPRGLVERDLGALDRQAGQARGLPGARAKVQQLAIALPSAVAPTPAHPMTPGSPGIAGASVGLSSPKVAEGHAGDHSMAA